MACNCSCGGDCKTTLLYSCSGAANTGYLADRVWRALITTDAGEGTCLAGVGADLSGFLRSAEEGDNILLDGCSVGCGKKMFEKKGLPFTQIVMTDYGVKKGETEITSDVVDRVAAKILKQINKAGV